MRVRLAGRRGSRRSVAHIRRPLTSSSSGLYPGAVPIDDSVTFDVAMANVQKVIAYIASIKAPNGVTPRFLKIRGLLLPPSLTARGQQISGVRLSGAMNLL